VYMWCHCDSGASWIKWEWSGELEHQSGIFAVDVMDYVGCN